MQPTGLTGGGVMTLDKAKVTADLFTYNANWFGSEIADLGVFDEAGSVAIKANNLRSYIDLETREFAKSII